MGQTIEMLDVHKYYDPTRPIEPKVKRDWKKKYLEFGIPELPGRGIIQKHDFEPGKKRYFDYIDDNYIMFDYSPIKLEYLIPGGASAFAFVFVAMPFLIRGGDSLIWILVPTILFLPIAIWQFFLCFKVPKERKVIFDRQRGLVQLPRTIWQRPQLIRFEELHAVMALRSMSSG